MSAAGTGLATLYTFSTSRDKGYHTKFVPSFVFVNQSNWNYKEYSSVKSLVDYNPIDYICCPVCYPVLILSSPSPSSAMLVVVAAIGITLTFWSLRQHFQFKCIFLYELTGNTVNCVALWRPDSLKTILMLHGDLSHTVSLTAWEPAFWKHATALIQWMLASLTVDSSYGGSHCGGSKVSTDLDTLGFKLKIIL